MYITNIKKKTNVMTINKNRKVNNNHHDLTSVLVVHLLKINRTKIEINTTMTIKIIIRVAANTAIFLNNSLMSLLKT